MRKKLWKIYIYTFIKTPIAAILIIIGLVVGLYSLMNNISIQHYITVTGISMDKKDATVIRVRGNYDMSKIHKQDKLTWYMDESGERYEGKVLSVNLGSVESDLELEIKPLNWEQVKKQSNTESTNSPVLIDLPQGKRTVFAQLFHKGATE